MKKIFLIFLLSSFVVCGLTGCGFNLNKFSIGEKSDVKIIDKGVSLVIKENTLTRTGVTLIMKNDSDNEVIYGEPYELEIRKDGEWHKIMVEISFNDPAYILRSLEFNEIKINWENEYGKLVPGEYRVIKNYWFENNSDSLEEFDVSAEFVIK